MTHTFGTHTEAGSENASASKVATPVIRYEGFEGIENGQRLTFRVKIPGQDAFHVMFDVLDESFRSTRGLTIQDAAPMAYEKLTELLSGGHSLESTTPSLTPTDITNYISRHRPEKTSHYTFGRRDAA